MNSFLGWVILFPAAILVAATLQAPEGLFEHSAGAIAYYSVAAALPIALIVAFYNWVIRKRVAASPDKIKKAQGEKLRINYTKALLAFAAISYLLSLYGFDLGILDDSEYAIVIGHALLAAAVAMHAIERFSSK